MPHANAFLCRLLDTARGVSVRDRVAPQRAGICGRVQALRRLIAVCTRRSRLRAFSKVMRIRESGGAVLSGRARAKQGCTQRYGGPSSFKTSGRTGELVEYRDAHACARAREREESKHAQWGEERGATPFASPSLDAGSNLFTISQCPQGAASLPCGCAIAPPAPPRPPPGRPAGPCVHARRAHRLKVSSLSASLR